MFSNIYESLLFLTTAAGAAVGGWIDFKTSEIPDEVPLFVAISALVLHIANGIFGSGWSMLGYGFAVGLAYLALGYLMYYSGQWGEADVLLLAAVGFAIPQPLSFFHATSGLFYPLLFLLNTFVVGAVYSLTYSFVKALKTPGFLLSLHGQMKEKATLTFALFAIIIAGMIALAASFHYPLAPFFLESVPFLGGLVFLYAMYLFAATVDRTVFRAKIPTTKLREGDVLAEDIPELKLSGKLFIGLTKEEVLAVKKKRKSVMIKEGVRYAPTFLLSILFTLFFGNFLLYIVGA